MIRRLIQQLGLGSGVMGLGSCIDFARGVAPRGSRVLARRVREKRMIVAGNPKHWVDQASCSCLWVVGCKVFWGKGGARFRAGWFRLRRAARAPGGRVGLCMGFTNPHVRQWLAVWASQCLVKIGWASPSKPDPLRGSSLSLPFEAGSSSRLPALPLRGCLPCLIR